MSGRERSEQRFVAVVLICGAALWLALPFLPRDRVQSGLWAFEHLFDWPLALRFAVSALLLTLISPRVRANLAARGAGIAARFDALPRALRLPLGAAALFGLLWGLRQHNFALGDSARLIEAVTQDVHMRGLHVSWDEPLELYLHSLAYRWTHALWGWDVARAYALLSCLAGLAAAGLAVAFWRLRAPRGRFGVALALCAVSASVQLFFGYVENYTLVAAAMGLYAVLSERHLAGRGGLAAPASALGLAISLHVLAGWLLPSLAYLWWASRATRTGGEDLATLATTAAALVAPVAASVLWLRAAGVPLADFGTTHLASLKFVFLIAEDSHLFRYPTFSLAHAVDRVNQLLLVALPGLLAGGLALLLARGRIDWGDPLLRFLGIGAFGLQLFALSWNPEIGAYRDWDLFAPIGFSHTLLGAYLLVRFAPAGSAALGGGAIVALCGSLTASWIASNALRTLEVDPLHALAHTRAGQVLAGAGDLDAALVEYEAALQIDPDEADARILLGGELWKRGERERASSVLREYLVRHPEGANAARVRDLLGIPAGSQ